MQLVVLWAPSSKYSFKSIYFLLDQLLFLFLFKLSINAQNGKKFSFMWKVLLHIYSDRYMHTRTHYWMHDGILINVCPLQSCIQTAAIIWPFIPKGICLCPQDKKNPTGQNVLQMTLHTNFSTLAVTYTVWRFTLLKLPYQWFKLIYYKPCILLYTILQMMLLCFRNLTVIFEFHWFQFIVAIVWKCISLFLKLAWVM